MRQQTEHNYSKENKFRSRRNHTALSRFFVALIFIFAGSILIAEKTGFISNELFHMIFNWQVLIISLGIVSISKENSNKGGFIMILIGSIFLIPEFINIDYNTKQLFWPAILIGVGLMMILRGKQSWSHFPRNKHLKDQVYDIDMINDSHIFGGGDFHITSNNFKGGKIDAIFGGGSYDFRNAQLADGTNILNVSLVFGGLEILVPASWDVKVEVTSILGGFSNKAYNYSKPIDSKGVLLIKGSAIFGGGEVKRY